MIAAFKSGACCSAGMRAGGVISSQERLAQQNDTLPRSKQEAEAVGVKHYFTGEKCFNGHIDKRHTSNQVCVSCQRMYARNWRRENPAKHRAIDARKSWLKWNNGKVPDFKHVTGVEIDAIRREQDSLCAYCGINLAGDEWQLDHIIPLSRGGDNSRENVHVVCGFCNSSKRDRKKPSTLNPEAVQ